jgi:3',5'-cyclic AMP phosphodiesterase CpdA
VSIYPLKANLKTKEVNMKFLHLSDLHIHTNEKDNKDVINLLSFVSETYPDHQLIITGDIADDGKIEQFDNAYKLLEPFKGQLFICPGNHDFGAVGSFYSYERALHFDEMLAKPLNQGGTFKGDSTPVVNILKDNNIKIMLIALDSNLETEHPFDFACGEIGESQLKALDTILSTPSNAEMVKVLFFHHHPFMVNDPFMELKDAKDLARTIYNRVDLVLFGHKHEMGEWQNRYNAQHVLASDNSPGKLYAKEITIDKKEIPKPLAVSISKKAQTKGKP